MEIDIILFILFILICGVIIYAVARVVRNLCLAIKERNKKWIINSIVVLLIEIVLLALLLPGHLDSGVNLFHKIFN